MTDKGWVDDFNLHYEIVDRLFERGQTFHNFNDHDYMVLEALSPIAEVVQNNSAAAQETSATSEELTAQATTLSGMVSVFKLRQ